MAHIVYSLAVCGSYCLQPCGVLTISMYSIPHADGQEDLDTTIVEIFSHYHTVQPDSSSTGDAFSTDAYNTLDLVVNLP